MNANQSRREELLAALQHAHNAKNPTEWPIFHATNAGERDDHFNSVETTPIGFARTKCHLQLNRGVVRRLSPRAPELNAKRFCNEIAEFAVKSRSKWGGDWFTI